MIYADPANVFDHEDCPGVRSQTCVNCGQYWDRHSGWSCSDKNGIVEFSKLNPSHRYLTQSMIDSLPRYPIVNNPIAAAQAKATSRDIEARLFSFFTSPAPGNCACNIPREQCRYHR